MDLYLKLRPDIVDDLISLDSVLDHLISDEYITTSNYNLINSKPIEANRIRTLLDILGRRRVSPKKFIRILDITGNDKLLNRFKRAMKDEERVVEETGVKTEKKLHVEEKLPKRKMFICQGLDEVEQTEIFENDDNYEVDYIFSSTKGLKNKINTLQTNQFDFIDIIFVKDNDEKENIADYLKNISSNVLKSKITMLIVFDGGCNKIGGGGDDADNVDAKIVTGGDDDNVDAKMDTGGDDENVDAKIDTGDAADNVDAKIDTGGDDNVDAKTETGGGDDNMDAKTETGGDDDNVDAKTETGGGDDNVDAKTETGGGDDNVDAKTETGGDDNVDAKIVSPNHASDSNPFIAELAKNEYRKFFEEFHEVECTFDIFVRNEGTRNKYKLKV